jgi:hypothetical protein
MADENKLEAAAESALGKLSWAGSLPIGEEPASDGPKKGVHTSEFYVHLVAVILGALATIAGIVESYTHGTVTSTGAMMAAIGVISATLNSLGYTASRTIVKASSVLLLVLALSCMGGCSAEQLAREEAAAHAALTKLEKAVDWANAHPETVGALLDDAASASSDPGFQKAIAKAKAHVAAGDLAKAQEAVHLGAALTAAAPVTSGQ